MLSSAAVSTSAARRRWKRERERFSMTEEDVCCSRVQLLSDERGEAAVEERERFSMA